MWKILKSFKEIFKKYLFLINSREKTIFYTSNIITNKMGV